MWRRINRRSCTELIALWSNEGDEVVADLIVVKGEQFACIRLGSDRVCP